MRVAPTAATSRGCSTACGHVPAFRRDDRDLDSRDYLVTYLNVFSVSHIHFSEERVYMALTMGAAMGVVMMAWMWGMYASGRWNIAVVASAVLLGMVATFLSQSQLLVKARSWANVKRWRDGSIK